MVAWVQLIPLQLGYLHHSVQHQVPHMSNGSRKLLVDILHQLAQLLGGNGVRGVLDEFGKVFLGEEGDHLAPRPSLDVVPLDVLDVPHEA